MLRMIAFQPGHQRPVRDGQGVQQLVLVGRQLVPVFRMAEQHLHGAALGRLRSRARDAPHRGQLGGLAVARGVLRIGRPAAELPAELAAAVGFLRARAAGAFTGRPVVRRVVAVDIGRRAVVPRLVAAVAARARGRAAAGAGLPQRVEVVQRQVGLACELAQQLALQRALGQRAPQRLGLREHAGAALGGRHVAVVLRHLDQLL